MSKQKYRVAVVGGAGTWGRRYLQTYAERADCEIVALIDRARDRRQAFAERYGVKVVFDSVEELLQHEIPNIVSIILPVAESPAAVMACAEAGVRVVSCEKPIALSLEIADKMVAVCRERGTALGCGTAHFELPYLPQTTEWVQAGNIGKLTGAAIPCGLPKEISGGGCVQLTQLRYLTGRKVEWVEGWTHPPDEAWKQYPGYEDSEVDRPAWGRIGLSGDIVCEVPEPSPELQRSSRVSVTGDNGQVWIGWPQPTFLQGPGPTLTPVHPLFLHEPCHKNMFIPTIERLIDAFDAGPRAEAKCSGHDYRIALEIAIAMIQSAQRDHKRVHLPLQDRTARIFPQPYRLHGGDVAGWINDGGPPEVL